MRVEIKCRNFTAKDIAFITNGKLIGDDAITVESIATDSREVEPGDMFLAIRGENFDGHDYIESAITRGAACILCEYAGRGGIVPGVTYIRVEDVTGAIGDLAHAVRMATSAGVIAITGSVGKTTTKEYVSALLSQKYKVHKTLGNYNNQLGLPLTILGMPKECDLMVLEMGMSGAGQIEYLSKIAEPDIALITCIGSSHIENLGSRENICRAKLEIVSHLKDGGMLIACGDEPLLRTPDVASMNPVYVGLNDKDLRLRANNIRYGDGGTTIDISHESGGISDICLPTLGEHNVYNALYAIELGLIFDLEEDDIRRGLLAFRGEKMRQNIYELGGITVIDDCYNASPESMCASIDVLCELSRERGGARKIALLGDMKELGAMTRVLHEKVGEHAANKKIDMLHTFGVAASSIADAAKACGMPPDAIFENHDLSKPEISAAALAEVLKAGDILLVKASRATSAETIIQLLSGDQFVGSLKKGL